MRYTHFHERPLTEKEGFVYMVLQHMDDWVTIKEVAAVLEEDYGPTSVALKNLYLKGRAVRRPAYHGSGGRYLTYCCKDDGE